MATSDVDNDGLRLHIHVPKRRHLRCIFEDRQTPLVQEREHIDERIASSVVAFAKEDH